MVKCDICGEEIIGEEYKLDEGMTTVCEDCYREAEELNA